MPATNVPWPRPSPAEFGYAELTKLTEAMYEQLVAEISMNRSVSREAVKQLIDDTIVNARDAKQRGFVDHLVHQDHLRKLITDVFGVTSFTHFWWNTSKA